MSTIYHQPGLRLGTAGSIILSPWLGPILSTISPSLSSGTTAGTAGSTILSPLDRALSISSPFSLSNHHHRGFGRRRQVPTNPVSSLPGSTQTNITILSFLILSLPSSLGTTLVTAGNKSCLACRAQLLKTVTLFFLGLGGGRSLIGGFFPLPRAPLSWDLGYPLWAPKARLKTFSCSRAMMCY